MGDDCVEVGAVIHKEHTDAGVFIFQVGEGIVENSESSDLLTVSDTYYYLSDF